MRVLIRHTSRQLGELPALGLGVQCDIAGVTIGLVSENIGGLERLDSHPVIELHTTSTAAMGIRSITHQAIVNNGGASLHMVPIKYEGNRLPSDQVLDGLMS